MSNVAHLPRLSPLKVINPSDWQGKPIPERQWLVPGVCVRGGATLLNGDGGVGKSLLCLQLQVALGLGMPWIGIPTPTGGPTKSLGIYCEDEPDELQRRLDDVCRYYSCEMKDLDGIVTMMSRVGEVNTLMQFSRREGFGQTTHFFNQVESLVYERGIECVIIDTAADTFGGLEIDREQVRTFVQKLRAWALKTRGTVVITQHPSVSGMASGAGSSGSTGWNNSVRSRVYLTAPKRIDDDGDEIPTDERILKHMKSNYGAKGSKIRLVWKAGVFRTVEEAGPQSFEDSSRTRELLLDLAVKFVKENTVVSPKQDAKNSLASKARSHKELGRLPFTYVLAAQKELERTGQLVIVKTKTSYRNTVDAIRPSWLRYADECEGNP